MTASTAFANFVVDAAPNTADVAVGIHMYGDAVSRRLAGFILSDAKHRALLSMEEVRDLDVQEEEDKYDAYLARLYLLETKESNDNYVETEAAEIDETDQERNRKLGSGIYYTVLGSYTAFDDSITAPIFRTVSRSVEDKPALIQTLTSGGALLAISGGMAFGLGLFARYRQKRREQNQSIQDYDNSQELVETSAEVADKPYSPASLAATTAIGVPLRVEMKELRNVKDIALHSLYYVTIGQALLYGVLDKVGATNGMFYGGIGAYVLYKTTKPLYHEGQYDHITSEEDITAMKETELAVRSVIPVPGLTA